MPGEKKKNDPVLFAWLAGIIAGLAVFFVFSDLIAAIIAFAVVVLLIHLSGPKGKSKPQAASTPAKAEALESGPPFLASPGAEYEFKREFEDKIKLVEKTEKKGKMTIITVGDDSGGKFSLEYENPLAVPIALKAGGATKEEIKNRMLWVCHAEEHKPFELTPEEFKKNEDAHKSGDQKRIDEVHDSIVKAHQAEREELLEKLKKETEP